MAPSETSILSKFLLAAASLPTVVSLQQFTELFPNRLRAHPHIRVLYRELQQLREQDMDTVNENIDREVRHGERQKAELRKSIAKTGVDGTDLNEQREMDMDVQLFGSTSVSSHEYHSISSLVQAMETACASIEDEIARVDRDAAALVSELNSTVGEMSDLRYGKMHGSVGAADDGVVDEALRGLKNLEDVCYNKRSMPSIPLHPPPSVARDDTPNPLPHLLQTPSGLALLELQGTINIPVSGTSQHENETTESLDLGPSSVAYETPVGKLMFPDYSPQNVEDDTSWMKRAYLYVGRYQRMTGEVKKLPNPLALIQRRPREPSLNDASEELEIVEIVKYKLIFKNRPEPVNDS
ncbi:Ctf8-domain-containing protein [Aspergillus lucknowensis]|uniref:Ctf8-domain-containing protein n=1 Tax=Aspergillus lucknowensis TaxID=176173 RepID=A0ABR4LEB1_9EURO